MLKADFSKIELFFCVYYLTKISLNNLSVNIGFVSHFAYHAQRVVNIQSLVYYRK